MLRDERGLRAFENRKQRKIFISKGGKETGAGEMFTMNNCIICSTHQTLFG
jgi:hypothetical protein